MIYDISKGHVMGVVTLDGRRVLYPQVIDEDRCTIRAPLVNRDGMPIFDHGRDDYALVERSGAEIRRNIGPNQSGLFSDLSVEQRSIIATASQFYVSHARPGELSDSWDRPRIVPSRFSHADADGTCHYVPAEMP